MRFQFLKGLVMSTEPVVAACEWYRALEAHAPKTSQRSAPSPSLSPQPLQVGPDKEGDRGREQPSEFFPLHSEEAILTAQGKGAGGGRGLCQELDTGRISGPSSLHGAHPILNFCRSAKCADTFKGGRKLWGLLKRSIAQAICG